MRELSKLSKPELIRLLISKYGLIASLQGNYNQLKADVIIMKKRLMKMHDDIDIGSQGHLGDNKIKYKCMRKK